MQIALAQLAGREGDIAYNLSRTLACLRDADAETSLIVFPETHLSGFAEPEHVFDRALTLDGPELEALIEAGRDRDLAVGAQLGKFAQYLAKRRLGEVVGTRLDGAARGLGLAKFVQLQAVLEMARRHAGESFLASDALSDPQATRRYLALKLADVPHEVFACVFLDNRNRVLAFEELFRGTIDGAAVYPREVVKAALRHNAASVILAHNHPSGVAEPSRADRDITRRLVDALALVDIRVLDHIVLGRQTNVSLAERGLM